MKAKFAESLIRRPSFLPRILDDETLYSWCCRYHRLSGNERAIDTSLQLFASQTAGLMHDFPGCLEEFVDRTNGRFGDVRTIAYSHTLFGFYAKFLTAELAEELVLEMKRGRVTRLKFRLGLPSSRIGAGHPLKACPACMEEDEINSKISYWHLAHQIPGRWLCPIHAVPLRESSIKTRAAQRLQWILPGDVLTDQWHFHENISADTRLALEKAGGLIDHLKADESLLLDKKYLRSAYLAKLKQIGWLTESRFVRMKPLRKAFILYAERLKSISEYHFVNSVQRDDGGCLGTLLRSPRRRVHPIKHLTFIAFLFNDWSDFLEFYRSSATGRFFREHASSPPSRDGRSNLKNNFLNLLSSENLSVTRAAIRCGISIDTATTWARQNNINFKERPKIMYPNVVRKIAQLLIDGYDRDDIAKQNGVSRQAVNRLVYSHPALRHAWATANHLRKLRKYRTQFLQTILEHPGLSMNAIRSIQGSGSQWLRRHDSEWLATPWCCLHNKD